MRLVLDARTAAFASMIDYAGVFPPASRPMADAVDTFRRLRDSDERWVVGRFLCRASQLEDLAAVATAGMTRGEPPWPVGVVMDMSPGAAASVAHEFQWEMAPAMEITAAEVRAAADDPGRLLDAVSSIDADVTPFIEIDRDVPLAAQVEAIGAALSNRGVAGGLKLRCGGVDADAFPSVADVAGFIWETSLADIPFKATAGLHAPLRHRDPELGVMRHGFVNILLASVAAGRGEPRSVVEAIVAETEPDAFALGPATASWRNIAFPGSAIRRSRMHGLHAFGSCDIDEPLAGLRSLGFLGEGA